MLFVRSREQYVGKKITDADKRRTAQNNTSGRYSEKVLRTQYSESLEYPSAPSKAMELVQDLIYQRQQGAHPRARHHRQEKGVVAGTE